MCNEISWINVVEKIKKRIYYLCDWKMKTEQVRIITHMHRGLLVLFVSILYFNLLYNKILIQMQTYIFSIYL